ncbi:hydantoinase/oxoprolinase family protein [Futiania mangrovi]|uniref:Hydantoinase/oxoprolinase family protein n=1 Tax=Futiania mangrovi TaxID=2959716 RepID=A0A9J6PGZ8_9PROT|nr:hydantoinase/oxoprolinase family protein [Futiania mangrovii]MCP1337083.1 hydantoinase/oxoprolinase family protein [Futiania mangrovii]
MRGRAAKAAGGLFREGCALRVGVEVGGTFTDLVAIEPGGVRVTKVPSVPRNPDVGAFNALEAARLDFSQIEDLAHGSTVATNAVLERRGGRIAFVTTRGFRDILAIQRHNRTRIYDLEYQKPRPVVARSDSFEVDERIASDGSVVTALDRAAVVGDLVPRLKAGEYDAIAICLLNAYANPAHEAALAQILAEEIDGVLVALSSEVSREFREFERASTTTLSAYVQPVIDRYLQSFERRLQDAGFRGRFSVMQSNGGRLPAGGMRRRAVSALLSGPAAGVTGAGRQAARSGFDNLITLDIGGTSTDVCLVTDGKPELTSEFHIEGLPVRSPVLDINTVGAGGGSIVWIDDGGMLRAGPQSAGADPGPACYGRGGTLPTLTDAHLIRGTIRAEAFLGGRMRVDEEAARAAFAPIAEALDMSVEEAAESAIRLADSNIVRAIQLISTERGKDPRDYVLVPFGGAGPLHAAHVAEDLGIRTIVVPPNAGVISAYGLVASDFVEYDTRTCRMRLDPDAPDALRAIYEDMRGHGEAAFREMGLKPPYRLSFVADMRFVGQAFEIPVELPVGDLDTLTYEEVRRAFTEAHHRIFFHGAGDTKPVEIVAARVGITAPLGELPLLTEDPHTGGNDAAPIRIHDGKQEQEAQAMPRSLLNDRRSVTGPALVDDPTSTIFVPAGWAASADEAGNLILRREER